MSVGASASEWILWEIRKSGVRLPLIACRLQLLVRGCERGESCRLKAVSHERENPEGVIARRR